MAKQRLLKNCVMKSSVLILHKIGLLLLIKAAALICVLGGGEEKFMGASEFRTLHLRLKWMEEESCM